MKRLFLLVLALVGFSAAVASAEARPVSITDQAGTEILIYMESHALVVGAGNYGPGWSSLDRVHDEVQRVARALEAQGFRVDTLLDPTGNQLRDAVRDFIAQYGHWRNNRLVFFFSGHGYTRESKGFFVPVDAPNPRNDLVDFFRRAIPMDQVMTWAREIEAKHALFAFDSCFSGTLFKAKSLPPATEALIRDSTSRPVRQFFTAGDAGEEVPAKSIFTPLFIKALEGKADFNGDGYVTGAEIGLYISQEMPRYDPALTPQYGKIRDPDLDEGDFVFQLTALPPPPPSPPSPPAETPVTVAEVQRLLAGRGYDPGPIDGILGGGTRAAIGRFQRDHGLAATGEPSAELVTSLRASPARADLAQKERSEGNDSTNTVHNFTLSQGKSIVLEDSGKIFSVVFVSGSLAKINLDGGPFKILGAGKSIDYSYLDQKCRIIVLEVDNRNHSAKFMSKCAFK